MFAAAAYMSAPQAAQAYSLITVPLFSHPNGTASADVNAVDNRDYGLRLDNGKTQTFHFVDVALEFFNPVGPTTSDTEFARITGTIAHLQSSNGVALGYSGGSGFDGTDQLWSVTASLKQIAGMGPQFPGGSGVPASDMLQKLIDGGLSGNAVMFGAMDIEIEPLFDEGIEAAVYHGPRSFTGKSMDLGGPVLKLTHRHRLDLSPFPAPEWDVVAGNGWLMATDGSGMGYTRDFLFYTNAVPEPATAALSAIGALLLLRRRRLA